MVGVIPAIPAAEVGAPSDSAVAAKRDGTGHTLDAERKGAAAKRNTMLMGSSQGLFVGPAQAILEFIVEPILGPLELLDVLRPLEVRTGHTTRVRKDVGDHNHSPVGKHVICLGRGRIVCTLEHDRCLHPIDVCRRQ